MIAGWAEALRPVRRHLLPHLAELLVADGQDAAGRRTITGLYGDYADGLPDAFATLETEASGRARARSEYRRARAATAPAGNRGRRPGLARPLARPSARCSATRSTRRYAAT